jgi:hypothetical protein
VLAEIYDATATAAFTPATQRLINASVLKLVLSGGNLTTGFVVAGGSTKQILVRAVGPTLAAAPFSIDGMMTAPQLVLGQSGVSTPLKTSSGWGNDPALAAVFARVGAFALQPSSLDSALLVTLSPGSYLVSVANGSPSSGGLVLVELYEVP